MQPQTLQRWHDAERLLAARQHDGARDAYLGLTGDRDLAPMAHLRLSLIASATGHHREAVDQALLAFAARQPDPDLLELLGKRLLSLCETEAALACATAPELLASGNGVALAELGKMLSDHMLPDQALQLLEPARRLGLDSAAMRYLVGLSRMQLGDIDAAERELQASLQADPDFARSARTLSKLRRQTPEHNHVEALRASLARLGPEHPEAPLLQFSLFKELDDLGDVEAAWSALETGMRLRRRQVRFDPADDVRLFEQLMQVQADPHAAGASSTGPVPVFIVGMPRSGTTLLERILGAHTQVADAGELVDLVFQLRWMCDLPGGAHLDAALASRARDIDWAQLGERYLAHTRWRANGRPFYTDKLPGNFLNVGFIAQALPQARILHMVRDPVDTCFSNLKELFANAYPHSYDQVEMADHYRRYRRLMDHWHAQFPGRVLDVQYDALVAEPARVAREVLQFCGLPWQEDVVDVQERGGAVATASSTQVREGIHQRFVGQWRRYADHLQPLRERLGDLAR